jgi:hypothetical protein
VQQIKSCRRQLHRPKKLTLARLKCRFPGDCAFAPPAVSACARQRRILKIGNLVRHELDADSLGAHKVHAVKSRYSGGGRSQRAGGTPRWTGIIRQYSRAALDEEPHSAGQRLPPRKLRWQYKRLPLA